MSLINQLFFAVLISSVTSTFLLLVWWMLRGFFMLVNPRMIYTTLRWICVLYVLPIGYVAVLLSYRVWFQGQDEVWMLVFTRTEEITDGLRVFSVLWLVISAGLFARRWLDNWDWCTKFQDNIEIDWEFDPVVRQKFEEVCRSLEINADRLSLQRNVLVEIPMVVGIRHPQIILPERNYTDEELGIIFYHELSHFKHKDLRCKILVVIITMIHCFNPVCYFLLRIVNVWSEFMADVSALESFGRIHDAKMYFNKILNLIPADRESDKERFLFSTLGGKDDNTLSRRVDFMKKYQRTKTAGRVITAALTAAFVMMSTTTIFASGKVVADLHNIIYQNTEGRIEETEKTVVTEDGFVEHYCDVEDLNFEDLQEVSTLEQDIVTIDSGVHYSIDWIVNPNTRHVSGPYTVSKGQKICAAVTVSPTNKDYWLGIMDHEGHARYVEGRGAAAHNFQITETKKYRVFVQNNYKDGKTTLHAEGAFVYE